MKKALSLALAVAMLFAVCVPAFAVNGTVQNTDGEPAYETVIKTVMIDEDGNDAEKYTVIIPATAEIIWGAEETVVYYSVEAHLGDGKALTVDVAGNGKMTFTGATGTVYELPYALGGDTAFTADSPVIFPIESKQLNIVIAQADWNTAVVGDYSDTLTFEVAC